MKSLIFNVFPYGVMFPLAVSVYAGFSRKWILLLISVMMFLMFYAFFRVPGVIIPTEPNAILSPGGGVVRSIKYSAENVRIRTFLSVFDVHVQYSPISGRVVSVKANASRKSIETPAYKTTSDTNTRIETTIQNSHGINVKVLQVAGLIANTITNFLNPGDFISQGDIMGIIHFGSRVDIILPKNKVKLMAKEKDILDAGKTVLAYFI